MNPTDAHTANRRGCFIVIEGIDGSGSTTQVKRLAEHFARHRYPVTSTCEPTAGPIGSMIRQALTKRLGVPPRLGADGQVTSASSLDYRTLALLFAADRADHNDVLIRPTLTSGGLVISDRYVFSSLAYQSLTAPAATDILPWLRQINDSAETPDLTIVLQVSAAVAAKRRALRGGNPELFEVDSLQQRLAQFYAAAEQRLSAPVCSVDANGDADAVFEAVLNAAKPLVAKLCAPTVAG